MKYWCFVNMLYRKHLNKYVLRCIYEKELYKLYITYKYLRTLRKFRPDNDSLKIELRNSRTCTLH